MATQTKAKSFTSEGSTVEYSPEQIFDNKQMRHFIDGKVSVLHCHHYATLFTQLACDAEQFKGPQLLSEASWETFYPVFNEYFKTHKITDRCDRINLVEQYFSFVGLGEIKFEFWDKGGTATLVHSHIDEGWVKKWGQTDKNVNFVGEGFIKASWAAIWDKKSPKKLQVEETQSIAQGASTSKFSIKW